MNRKVVYSFLLLCIVLSSVIVISCNGRTPVIDRRTYAQTVSFQYADMNERTVSKTYNLYFGHRTDSVLMTSYHFLSDTVQPKILINGDDDTVANLNNKPASKHIKLIGNVCKIELSNYSQSGAGIFGFDTLISFYTKNRAAVPEIDSMSAKVKSYPMILNQPVYMFFSEADSAESCFLTISGIKDKTVDIMFEGAAELLVGDRYTGFVLSAETAIDVIRGDEFGFATYRPVNPGRDTLFFTLKPIPKKTRQVKLCVNENSETLNLVFHFRGNLQRFNMSDANEFRNVMTDIIADANRFLYGATAGRVRISDVSIFVGAVPTIPGVVRNWPPQKPDIAVDFFDYPSEFWRSHAVMWTGPISGRQRGILIELDGEWWRSRNGSTIAHELGHYRYLLPDEYEETADFSSFPPGSNTTSHCTNCMMCDSSPHFCFPGSHNPDGSGFLSDESSCWEILAPQLNVPVPDRTTPDIIETSAVRMPVNISINIL